MSRYEIRRNQEALFTVEASTPDEAAAKALPLLFPKTKRLTVHRTTGDHGKSGYFQAYERTVHGECSLGQSFHVF